MMLIFKNLLLRRKSYGEFGDYLNTVKNRTVFSEKTDALTPILSVIYPVPMIQSTLFVSKSMGLSEILRGIRTSTYQICRIEEKISRTTACHLY